MSNATNPRDTGGVSPLAAGRAVTAPPPRPVSIVPDPIPATPPNDTPSPDEPVAEAPAPVAEPKPAAAAKPPARVARPAPTAPIQRDASQWANRGGFRTIAVQFTDSALQWFDERRQQTGMSQRELLLELIAKHGTKVNPKGDRVTDSRAALGLTASRPRRRKERTRPVSLSIRPDEADVLDTRAAEAGMSRSGFVDALIAAARAKG